MPHRKSSNNKMAITLVYDYDKLFIHIVLFAFLKRVIQIQRIKGAYLNIIDSAIPSSNNTFETSRFKVEIAKHDIAPN